MIGFSHGTHPDTEDGCVVLFVYLQVRRRRRGGGAASGVRVACERRRALRCWRC